MLYVRIKDTLFWWIEVKEIYIYGWMELSYTHAFGIFTVYSFMEASLCPLNMVSI